MSQKASERFKNFIESGLAIENSRTVMNLEGLVAELIAEYGLQAVLEAVSDVARQDDEIAVADELDYVIRDYL